MSGGEPLSRRRLLQAGVAGGALLGTGGLAGLFGTRARAAAAGPAGPGSQGYVGSRPSPGLPEGTDTLPHIRHIIVLMMENHSFDNHLGMLSRPGVDGFALGPGGRPLATNPYPDGRVQHAFAMPTTCQLASRPSQTWVASHVQDDGGRNDGFVRSASGPVAMGYWGPEDLPFYYSLAATFPVADRYFCSLLGQTYPNRRYLMAATSLGQVDDTRPGPTDYPPNGTIFDRLAAHRIPWRDYVSDLPTTALFPPLASRYPGSTVPIAQFFTDAAQGTLPGFAIVDPQFTATSAGPGEVGGDSEENPQNIAAGEAFAARVIRAVMSGPAWASTVLVWTFDEHGGYYDHVPPPAAVPPDEIPPAVPSGQAYDGFARYGFRVPAVVVSPWSRPGLVSHTVFDHTSILKLVETKWNLPSLTARDANATSLSELLDPGRPAFLTPPSLAQPKLATDPGVLSCNATGPGTIPPPGSVS